MKPTSFLPVFAALALLSPFRTHAVPYTYLTEEDVRRDLHRFLTQATFGANEWDVEALFQTIATPRTTGTNVKIALSAWIDQQFAMAQTELYLIQNASDQQEWVKRAELMTLQNSPSGATVYRNKLNATGNPVGLGQSDYATNNSYYTNKQPGSANEWSQWTYHPNPDFAKAAYTKDAAGQYVKIPDPGVSTLPYRAIYNHRRDWWLLANRARDQLRQRVAAALAEIFVVSDIPQALLGRIYPLSRYHDMLADHADGVRHVYPPRLPGDTSPGTLGWGNELMYRRGTIVTFKDLLRDVTLSPVMGFYLSHLKNQKESGIILPDENYAREVLQLFSIGLYKLAKNGTYLLDASGERIPTYSQEDIRTLARVFTGFSHRCEDEGIYGSHNIVLNDRSSAVHFIRINGNSYYSPGWEAPMEAYYNFHDRDLKKFDLLGWPDLPVKPAAQDETAYAKGELEAVIESIYRHTNVPPFIGKQLIQRFVTSNPSPSYIARVSDAFINLGGDRGSIPIVIKAILLDDEARDLARVNTTSFGKIKEPMIRLAQVMRACDAQSALPVTDLAAYLPTDYANRLRRRPNAGPTTEATRFRFAETNASIGQTPFHAPSVFNWFFPDYRNPDLPAGLVSPELQLATESSVIANLNAHYALDRTPVSGNGYYAQALPWASDTDMSARVRLVIDPFVSSYSTDLALVDRLDLLLCAGALKARYPNLSASPETPRMVVVQTVGGIAAVEQKVMQALYLITSTPEFIVQK